MDIRQSVLLLGLAVAGMGTASAAVHTLTYQKVSVAPGTEVVLGGEDYVMVRIPFADYEGARYSVIMPVPAEGFASVQTTHTDAAFTSNITIDGLPARIRILDTRSYLVTGLIGTASQFNVASDATVTLDIKIGDTLVSLFAQRSNQETNANAGATTDYRSFAQWARYTDLTADIQALDNLIDRIRIIRP